jgi:hypothetical protein
MRRIDARKFSNTHTPPPYNFTPHSKYPKQATSASNHFSKTVHKIEFYSAANLEEKLTIICGGQG